MAKKAEDAAVAEQEEVLEEDRVDEFALSRFRDLKFEGRLPDLLVETYHDFKRNYTKLHGRGRISGEAFSTVVLIFELKKTLLGG